jgi:uncharacterized protein (DUF924 family)
MKNKLLEANEILMNIFVTWFGFSHFRRDLPQYQKHDNCDLDNLWRNLWFSKTPETDAFLKSKFGCYIYLLQDYEPANDIERIGAIIMYDQLTRNVFRGSSDAYRFDHIARRHARILMPRFDDFPVYVQICLILVLIHTEDMSHQNEAVRLHRSIVLKNPTCPIVTKTLARIVQVHWDQVSLFGRLPQRQLFKQSDELTPEERDFLKNTTSCVH